MILLRVAPREQSCQLVRDPGNATCEDVFLPMGLLLQVEGTVAKVSRIPGLGPHVTFSATVPFDWRAAEGKFSPDGRKLLLRRGQQTSVWAFTEAEASPRQLRGYVTSPMFTAGSDAVVAIVGREREEVSVFDMAGDSVLTFSVGKFLELRKLDVSDTRGW
mmetsp:Transcript_32464/g.95064  ORF Transcript_32464/g.95064 Transcript_32464/m.95064 type:complete len:161 (+) Transcript_32464:1349-1831(+)